MAFPLLVILFDAAFFVKDDLGILAITGYVIGFLEAALFGEGGSKLSHADFLWPMMCGMMLVWVAAMLHLLVLEKTEDGRRGQRVAVNVCFLIFGFHVLYGLLYIQNTLTVG